ncbi:MAG: hypothetical protein IPO09_09050 [Anaeromyxobacter sp.]|nr:hypothetical protein [Anaeromyxobacter sp.]
MDTTTDDTTTTAGGDDGYEYGGHGRARAVKKIASNVAAFIRKEWGHRVRHNERHGRIEVDGQPFQLQGRVRNDLIRSMCRRFGWDTEPSLEILTQGLIEAAEADTFDPVVEYLDSLKWDGRDRIREFLAALGAALSTLTLAILLKTLIAAVARARRPGCKAEVVTIFVGPQGAGKSMAWRVLASAPERNKDPSAPSDIFSDAPVELNGNDKDSSLKSVSPWIHELAELATKKSADRDQVKAALSQQTEVFRPPYGREVQSRPRRGIRVGSTNETQFLNDPTGARRWWPVEVGEIDIPWIMANRDQLWAQADAAFTAKIAWWFERGEHAEELSERHEGAYDADALELLLAERLTPDLTERWRADGAVLVGEVALVVGIDLARAPRNVPNRLGDALRRLGYRRTQVRRGSQRVKAWKHRSWDCVTPPTAEVDPLG